MDNAYVFMAIAFGANFVLGLLAVKKWMPVCLSAFTPSIGALVFFGLPAGKDIGQAFALGGPFLIAATIWYLIIGLAGYGLGKRVGARYGSKEQKGTEL